MIPPEFYEKIKAKLHDTLMKGRVPLAKRGVAT
jgi:hypothetical protein